MNKTLEAKEILGKHIDSQRSAKQFRLPAERLLANQLGFSRATIGKALGILEGEGVIFRKKGSGTFIKRESEEKTLTIALVMRTAYHYTDSHFRLIVEEVSKYAERNNIFIQIFDRLPDLFKSDPDDNALMHAIKNKIIDGVLIASRMPIEIAAKIKSQCPVVSINNVVGDGEEIPSVSCDYYKVGFLAAKYFEQQGFRRLAYLTTSLKHSEAKFNISGFESALDLLDIPFARKDMLATKNNPVIMEKNIREFFTGSSYQACFARNYSLAMQIFKVLKKFSIPVPENFQIITAGKYNVSKSQANLIVIDTQLDEMCHEGLDILMKMINNKNENGGLKLFTPRLADSIN